MNTQKKIKPIKAWGIVDGDGGYGEGECLRIFPKLSIANKWIRNYKSILSCKGYEVIPILISPITIKSKTKKV